EPRPVVPGAALAPYQLELAAADQHHHLEVPRRAVVGLDEPGDADAVGRAEHPAVVPGPAAAAPGPPVVQPAAGGAVDELEVAVVGGADERRADRRVGGERAGRVPGPRRAALAPAMQHPVAG